MGPPFNVKLWLGVTIQRGIMTRDHYAKLYQMITRDPQFNVESWSGVTIQRWILTHLVSVSRMFLSALTAKIWRHIQVSKTQGNGYPKTKAKIPASVEEAFYFTKLKVRCWKPPGHYLCIPEPGRPDCVISIEIGVNGDTYPVAISPRVTKNLPVSFYHAGYSAKRVRSGHCKSGW